MGFGVSASQYSLEGLFSRYSDEMQKFLDSQELSQKERDLFLETITLADEVASRLKNQGHNLSRILSDSSLKSLKEVLEIPEGEFEATLAKVCKKVDFLNRDFDRLLSASPEPPPPIEVAVPTAKGSEEDQPEPCGLDLLNQGKNELALQRLEQELAEMKESTEQDSYEIAECLHNIGRCHVALNAPGEALTKFQSLLIFCERKAKTLILGLLLICIISDSAWML